MPKSKNSRLSILEKKKKERKKSQFCTGTNWLNEVERSYKTRDKFFKEVNLKQQKELFSKLLEISPNDIQRIEPSKTSPAVNIYQIVHDMNIPIAGGYSHSLTYPSGKLHINLILMHPMIEDYIASVEHEEEHVKTRLLEKKSLAFDKIKTLADLKEKTREEILARLAEFFYQYKGLDRKSNWHFDVFTENTMRRLDTDIENLYNKMTEFQGKSLKVTKEQIHELQDKLYYLMLDILKVSDDLILPEIMLVIRKTSFDNILPALKKRVKLKKIYLAKRKMKQ
jgi:hypothetical protein